MFLFEVMNLIYTSLFLIMFCISYFVVIQLRIEELFKKSSVWEIRVFQVLLAIIIAYLTAKGLMSLVESF